MLVRVDSVQGPGGAVRREAGESEGGSLVGTRREAARGSLMRRLLAPIVTPRFVRFCAVGATGVVVNLGFLGLFKDVVGWHVNVSQAIAIELSIVSNFLIHHHWTFADLRGATRSTLALLGRYHLVSLFGAVSQLAVFVLMNMVWLAVVVDPDAARSYAALADGALDRYLIRPVVAPPEVGPLVYVSSLAGIGVATLWNFLVNFHWTWSRRHAARSGT